MSLSRAKINTMREKGFDLCFQPNSKDAVFMSSSNIGEEQEAKLKEHFGLEVYVHGDTIAVYDPAYYAKGRRGLSARDTITVKSYPWVLKGECFISYGSTNARVLDLTDWIGTIDARRAFSGAPFEVVQLGESAELQGEFNSTFASCTRLQHLYSESEIAPKGKMFNTFLNCSALKGIDTPNLYFQGVTSMEQVFARCSSLEMVDLSSVPPSCKFIRNFEGCDSLAYMYSDIALSNGTLQDWCKLQYKHNLFVNVHGSCNLSVIRTNLPDAQMIAKAESMGLKFAREGSLVAIYKDVVMSMDDREVLVELFSPEFIRANFENFHSIGISSEFSRGMSINAFE